MEGDGKGRRLGASIIQFPDRKIAENGKGFKEGMGKQRGMVEEKPLITDVNEILRVIHKDALELERRRTGQWSRQEIIEDMMKMHPGLKKELLDLLQIPDKLYRVGREDSWEFVSEKGKSHRAEMHEIVRTIGHPLPTSIDFYSMGIVAFGDRHGAFFLTDPKRKLIFIDFAPDPSEEGHWGELIRPLKQSVDWLKSNPREDFIYLLSAMRTLTLAVSK